MDANELGLATDEAGVIVFFEPRMNTDAMLLEIGRGSRCLAFRGCPALLRLIRGDPCQSVACDSGASVPLPPRIPLP